MLTRMTNYWLLIACVIAASTANAQTKTDDSGDMGFWNLPGVVPPRALVDQTEEAAERSLAAIQAAAYESSRWQGSLRLRSQPNYWDMSLNYQVQALYVTLAARELLDQGFLIPADVEQLAGHLTVANYYSGVARRYAELGAQAMGETKNYGLIRAVQSHTSSTKAIELLVIVIDPGMF